MFRVVLLGADSAERLARKLTASAVRLAIGTAATAAALSHTVEGITTALVREEAPHGETGALRAGLHAQVITMGGEHIVTWLSDAPYGRYVLEGTGLYHQPDAHQEWDVFGYQHFTTAGGEEVHTMHTHHRGQHPNPFTERAEERAAAPIHAALQVAGAELLLTWARTFEEPL
jgi:hypothetical protein